jgi:acetylornithine deacetylase/succinyl-diaminopimelate desuccinylase-like protein
LTEPSEGRLILAHKGFVWAKIVTTGRAAHGGRWDLGVSAIAKMGRIISVLESIQMSGHKVSRRALGIFKKLHCGAAAKPGKETATEQPVAIGNFPVRIFVLSYVTMRHIPGPEDPQCIA